MNQQQRTEQQQRVKEIYEEIAEEYDERIPGTTPTDQRFSETEMEFLFSRITGSDKVLDMGCGTGRFTLPLAKAACQVHAVDFSEAMLRKLQEKACKQEVSIFCHQAQMSRMPFEDGTFDVVTCMLALMHLPVASRQEVFLEVSRVLKPGGTFLISVKNALFERLSTADRFATIDIADVEHKELVFTNTRSGKELRAPWYSFSPQELTSLLGKAGLQLTSLRGSTPLSSWLSDAVLAEPSMYELVKRFETAFGDIPPFNHLGYYLFAEAVKPLG